MHVASIEQTIVRSGASCLPMRLQWPGFISFLRLFHIGKDALISGNGANAPTVVAVAVDAKPVGAARSEVEAVGVERDVQIPRRRPVVAVLTSAVEVATPAVTRSGQEDAIAIDFAGEFPTVHAIERRPFAIAVVKQLLDIVRGRHTPVASPFHMCHVVFRTADV